ncbi:hypothetical protein BBF96_07100 [Anoxybacter fermentans]|uniref:Protein kinase domain-containing protein n=1 Tax=Anoxybacter fermentans TaxID=1323375 RepID=A0A3S9SYD8_9FIRM|nr:hypothetical protein [Anoxybacter fermentans]AZR73172.1 hypothetical protein BBF96_07100 [Anoxybacter fermentans]
MKLPIKFRSLNLEMIGSGSQGIVYKIDDNRCIKIYKKKKYFKRELKCLQRGQQSPFFPEIFEWGKYYIIREYIKGTPLNQHLKLNPMTLALSKKIIKLLRTFKNLGFRSIDMHPRHIFITHNLEIKIIDPTNMMLHHRTFPRKLFSELEKLGQKKIFLQFVKTFDPEIYHHWKKYINDFTAKS